MSYRRAVNEAVRDAGRAWMELGGRVPAGNARRAIPRLFLLSALALVSAGPAANDAMSPALWGAKSRGLRLRARVASEPREPGRSPGSRDEIGVGPAEERVLPLAIGFEIRNEQEESVRLVAPARRLAIPYRTKPRAPRRRLRTARPGEVGDMRWDLVTGTHFTVEPAPSLIEIPAGASYRDRVTVHVAAPREVKEVELRVEYAQYDNADAWIGTVRSPWIRLRLEERVPDRESP